MHYTSVPNILKVLNPLFLDAIRKRLDEAGDNSRKLLNLRNRMARIRVFDPACGSGNFLVIAYKEMRGIEAEINERRGEKHRRSDISLTISRDRVLRDFLPRRGLPSSLRIPVRRLTRTTGSPGEFLPLMPRTGSPAQRAQAAGSRSVRPREPA